MRSEDNLAIQLSSIIKEIRDLKTSQLVGTNQVVIKHTITPYQEVVLSSEFAYGDIHKELECVATAPKLKDGNNLIAYCVVEARKDDGSLVENKNFDHNSYDPASNSAAYVYGAPSNDPKINKWGINLIQTNDTPGATTTWQVRAHIFSSATMEVELNEKNR